MTGSAKEQSLDTDAGDVQVAGDDETIAAIVALAAADDDNSLDVESLDRAVTCPSRKRQLARRWRFRLGQPGN
jgi:hypothetical protein